MATRGSVGPNLVSYQRRLDRSPEKTNDKRNLAQKQTLFAIRSEMENKLMQMNELKDKLEDSEKCLQKERESRKLAEDRLHLVDLYNNPDINAELRHRLPRASDVDPFRCSSSVIQDSSHSVLPNQITIQDSSDTLKPCTSMQQIADSHLINTSEVAEIPLSQNGDMIQDADDPLSHGNVMIKLAGDTTAHGGNKLLQVASDPLSHHNKMLQNADDPFENGGNRMLQIAGDPLSHGGNKMLQVANDPLTNNDMLLLGADYSKSGEVENLPTQRCDRMLEVTDDHATHGDKVAEDPLSTVDRMLEVTDDPVAHCSEVEDPLLQNDDRILQIADGILVQGDGSSYQETSITSAINNKELAVSYQDRLSTDTDNDISKQTVQRPDPESYKYDRLKSESDVCNTTGIGHHLNQDITLQPTPQHVEIQDSQTLASSLTEPLFSTDSSAVPHLSQYPSSRLPSTYFQNNSSPSPASPTWMSMPAGQVSSRSGSLASSTCMLMPVGQASYSSRSGPQASQVMPMMSGVSSPVMLSSTPYSCKVVPEGHRLPTGGNISVYAESLPTRSSSPIVEHVMKSTENSNHFYPSIPGAESAFHSIPSVQSSHTSVHSFHPLFCSTTATQAIPLSSSLYKPPFIPPSSSTLPAHTTISRANGGYASGGPSVFVPGSRSQDYVMIPSSNEDIFRELHAAVNTIEKMNENYSALQQENEQLKLHFKEREAELTVTIAERLASLTREMYAAQDVRDAAMMEKGAMQERERIAEADAIFSRADGGDSTDEDGDFLKDAFNSDNINILDEQGKQLLSKIECLNTENNVNIRTMESLIQERNSAMFKCNMLQSELRQQEMHLRTNLAGDDLTAHQDKIFKLQEKCDYWKNRVKELEDESINLRVYYSLHKSLSQETAQRNSLETFENEIVKTNENASLTRRENRWLMDQLRAVTAQRDELARRLEERTRFNSGSHADKEKISRLERKVTVLQKKLCEIHGQQHRSE